MIDARDTMSVYHPIALALKELFDAKAVMLVVVGGSSGTGGGSVAEAPEQMRKLAAEMRRLAEFQERHADDIVRRG